MHSKSTVTVRLIKKMNVYLNRSCKAKNLEHISRFILLNYGFHRGEEIISEYVNKEPTSQSNDSCLNEITTFFNNSQSGQLMDLNELTNIGQNCILLIK